MPTDQNTPYADYLRYLATQCSYWFPGSDDSYLAGETVQQWHHREHLRQTMAEQQKELDRLDGVLSGLLFAMKKKLSRLGRNGAWSGWLKQQKISRSTADRLVAEHLEHFGLRDKLPHREPGEPLEGNICLAARRGTRSVRDVLRTPQSKLRYIKAVAGVLGLDVELKEGCDGVTISTVPPSDEESVLQQPVPNVLKIMEDGETAPVNYELTAKEIF